MSSELDQQCINTLRFLSVDMVQKANSGPSGPAARRRADGLRAVDTSTQVQPAQSALVQSRPLRALGRERFGADANETAVGARLAVELGAPQGWERYTGAWGDMFGVERFGTSAPAAVLLNEYGFTVDKVCARAKALILDNPTVPQGYLVRT